MDIPLEKLVDSALNRQAKAAIFRSLFHQWCHRQSADLSSVLPLYVNCWQNNLQTSYIVDLAMDEPESITGLFSLISDTLPHLQSSDQHTILNQLTLSKEFENVTFSETEWERLAECLEKRTLDSDEKRWFYLSEFIRKIGLMLENPPSKMAEIISKVESRVNPESNQAFLHNEKNIAMINNLTNTSTSNSLMNIKRLKSQKIVWLCNIPYIALVSLEDQLIFLDKFKALINLTSPAVVASELLESLFELHFLSRNQPFQKDVEIFILLQFPVLCENLKLSHETLLQVVRNVFDSFNPDLKNGSLESTLVESLISFGLVKEKSDKVEKDAQKFSLQYIENEVQNRIVDIDPDLTSLEESGLVPLFSRLSQCHCSRSKLGFAQTLCATLDSFIQSGNSSNLSRLLLAVCLDDGVVALLMSQFDPHHFVCKILIFMQSWKSSWDQNNYQEALVEFNALFLAIKYLTTHYHLEVKNLPLPPEFSWTFLLKLLQGGDLVFMNPDLENAFGDASSPINRLTNEWIRSIFNVGEGISDELIKSSSIEDCFILIPVIFKEALLALELNSITFESFSNGLEYFLQPFLIATTLCIFDSIKRIAWAASGNQSRLGNLSKTVEILLLEKIPSGDAHYLQALVCKIVSPRLSQELELIDGELLKKLKPKSYEPCVTSLPEFSCQVFGLISWAGNPNGRKVPEIPFYQLGIIMERLGADNLTLDFASQLDQAQNGSSTGMLTNCIIALEVLCMLFVRKNEYKVNKAMCRQVFLHPNEALPDESPQLGFLVPFAYARKELESRGLQNVGDLFVNNFLHALDCV